MDLKLHINKISLQPGAKIDAGMLADASFRKVGWFKRLFKPLPEGQELFVANNCTVDCFDDRLNLYPCTDSYLNRDRQWHTRASILLVEDQIQKVEFHVVDGVYAAPHMMDDFENICSESFGPPKKLQTNHNFWKNDQLSFSGYLHADSINADFSIEILE